MNASLMETLYSAAIYTFEQLVFMLPEVPPDELQRRRPVTAVATIAFSGTARGRLQLHAGEGLLPRLTANMMGVDAPSETLQLDALGEIANIICGQVLPSLDPLGEFEQTPPEVVITPEMGVAPATSPSAHAEIGLEASRADLLLYLYTDNTLRSAS